MRSFVKRVFKHYLKATTLHGFKYLLSPFYVDRVGWVVCCCASACCAGVLCTVLWARFMQVPALLTLMSTTGNGSRAPAVAVCPSAHTLARLFQRALPLPNHTIYLPNLFEQIIRNKPLPADSLELLQRVLPAHHLTLSDALVKVAPPCGDLIVKCRWMLQKEPCERLFRKTVISRSVCCVAYPEILNAQPILKSGKAMSMNARLDLVLNCSGDSAANGCEFFTKYPGEDWILPTALSTGYNYVAQISFEQALDTKKEKLVDDKCVSDPGYSRRQCNNRCKESRCGCTDPLRQLRADEGGVLLPRCSLQQINCLRSFDLIEEACGCRQSCTKILTDTVLLMSRMDQLRNTFDPFFVGVNESLHTALSVQISSRGNKVLDLWHTETWWSLISSLGGVFNMFLGVGLFSALELVSLLIHRLPLAIRRSAEINTNTALVQHVPRRGTVQRAGVDLAVDTPTASRHLPLR